MHGDTVYIKARLDVCGPMDDGPAGAGRLGTRRVA